MTPATSPVNTATIASSLLGQNSLSLVMYGVGTTAMITMGQSYASSARWAQRFKGKAWVLDRVVAAIDGGSAAASFRAAEV